MAKRSSPKSNPTPAFFAGIDEHAPSSIRVRPLPPSTQVLFLPALIAEAAASKLLDGYAERRHQAHAAFKAWIASLRSGVIHKLAETQVEQDFTSKLLKSLGYTTVTDVPPGQPWSMTSQWNVPGGGRVDVAIGRFHADEHGGVTGVPTVMVELKGAGTDLDRQGSGKTSAVQQAWGYLNASESAKWAIVSNYVEIRLYSRKKTSNHVHRIIIEDLEDPEEFADFFAIFHADGLVEPAKFPRPAAAILEETGLKQESVSRKLYEDYKEHRMMLIEEIPAGRPGLTLDQAIAAAQKLLDRILFLAFAEDRDLLKDSRTIEAAAASRRPGSTRWRAFQELFHAMDVGDEFANIPRFNGELFKPDPTLDDPAFRLDDEKWPTFFKAVGGYDFRNEVTVDILGQIFERSITDIEDIRLRGLAAHRADHEEERKKSEKRRSREGVFYTHPAVTGYLVSAALDPAWQANRAELLARHALADDVPETHELPSPALARYSRDRLAWLDGLAVCDPACGSGAFLVAAYEWFESRRCALLDDLKLAEPDAPEADGDRDDWIARSAPRILHHNLHGVDLSPESVEIARLSLWVRTARRGQPLADLARNVVCGNSLVDDPDPELADLHPFDWRASFPAVFARGGFDAVVGNPPYVRQEWLGKRLKDHLAARFVAFHGMADLYVYFYERALQVLRPGGRLAFIVTNKWMKAGYGEPLRRLFAEGAWVESVVDFGHAKQFFKEADVFPCFLVARKPDETTPPDDSRVCSIPRDLVQLDELKALVADRSLSVRRDRLGSDSWNLEPAAVADLLTKIRDRGIPLTEFAGVKPYYGIKTGLNEAFLIDTPTRDALIRDDPRSSEIIKPYLRGQDIKRWSPEWAGLWMIFTRRGIDIDAYPAVKRHLQAFRDRLEPQTGTEIQRGVKGRKPGSYKWYEIQDPVDYWKLFESEKIVYQEIQFHPRYSLDMTGNFSNNKTFFIPVKNTYLLSVLNSSVMWWHNWRYLPHMKDEALTPVGFLMEALPIAIPGEDVLSQIEHSSDRLLLISRTQQNTRRAILDWLHVEYDVQKPTTKLLNPAALSPNAFVAEVRKSRSKAKGLTAAGLASLRDEYARTIDPARALADEARLLESRLSDLVNAAYGLTPDEVRLMWDTAPPRMPISRPQLPT